MQRHFHFYWSKRLRMRYLEERKKKGKKKHDCSYYLQRSLSLCLSLVFFCLLPYRNFMQRPSRDEAHEAAKCRWNEQNPWLSESLTDGWGKLKKQQRNQKDERFERIVNKFRFFLCRCASCALGKIEQIFNIFYWWNHFLLLFLTIHFSVMYISVFFLMGIHKNTSDDGDWIGYWLSLNTYQKNIKFYC